MLAERNTTPPRPPHLHHPCGGHDDARNLHRNHTNDDGERAMTEDRAQAHSGTPPRQMTDSVEKMYTRAAGASAPPTERSHIIHASRYDSCEASKLDTVESVNKSMVSFIKLKPTKQPLQSAFLIMNQENHHAQVLSHSHRHPAQPLCNAGQTIHQTPPVPVRQATSIHP